MKKRKMSFTTVGGSSILTIFAVLCFIVFALLSLSTAKANSTLSQKSVNAIGAYYEADTAAEEILAQIRSGEQPEGVIQDGDIYSYTCSIDENQELQVEVEITGDSYKINKWQKKYTGEWKADDSMKVWGGMEITE
ncbi:MAG: hypothetical protein J1F22_06455 [Lachnospiraceae bacterium]|nr:hypothetical protein [Lachnospiraceae bacterium]